VHTRCAARSAPSPPDRGFAIVARGDDLASELAGMKRIAASSRVVVFPGPMARWWRRLLRGMRYGVRSRTPHDAGPRMRALG